ncbi:hypothetical protein BKA69DRAFT_1076528 [Paraphysoderma sedebokerense]|nr:hypothetical protein BKA69DRAFT_1076528 [Paraphysoderma sedebokerense]
MSEELKKDGQLTTSVRSSTPQLIEEENGSPPSDVLNHLDLPGPSLSSMMDALSRIYWNTIYTLYGVQYPEHKGEVPTSKRGTETAKTPSQTSSSSHVPSSEDILNPRTISLQSIRIPGFRMPHSVPSTGHVYSLSPARQGVVGFVKECANFVNDLVVNLEERLMEDVYGLKKKEAGKEPQQQVIEVSAPTAEAVLHGNRSSPVSTTQSAPSSKPQTQLPSQPAPTTGTTEVDNLGKALPRLFPGLATREIPPEVEAPGHSKWGFHDMLTSKTGGVSETRHLHLKHEK